MIATSWMIAKTCLEKQDDVSEIVSILSFNLAVSLLIR